jgi:hypothetical protein
LEHEHYSGQAFRKWIDDETHYCLTRPTPERGGFRWDPERGRFDAEGDFSGAYNEERRKVLRAAVRRAVEFFRDCEGFRWVPKGDDRNLRAPLGPYTL